MGAIRDSLDSGSKRGPDPRLEIAPMLDVTFLLLIFFLCILDFKVLEGRLEAFLPRDGASSTTEPDDTRESIEVRLVRARAGLDHTTVFVSRRPIGRLEGSEATAGTQTRVVERLEAELGRLRRSLPDSTCRIDAADGVPHGHVVAVVDAAMRRGFESVGFARR